MSDPNAEAAQAAQESPHAAPAANGTQPPTEPMPAPTSPDMGRELLLIRRTVVEIDVRLQALQVGTAITVGLLLLLIAAEVIRRKGGNK